METVTSVTAQESKEGLMTKRSHPTRHCPSCKNMKTLRQTLSRIAVLLAVLAEPAALLQFQQRGVGLDDHANCFRICNNCYITYQRALSAAKTQMNFSEYEPKTVTRQRAKVLDEPFTFDGGQTTLCDIFSEVADKKRELDPSRLSGSSKFKVGEAVVVTKRTMAGENKPGGHAIVTTALSSHGSTCTTSSICCLLAPRRDFLRSCFRSQMQCCRRVLHHQPRRSRGGRKRSSRISKKTKGGFLKKLENLSGRQAGESCDGESEGAYQGQSGRLSSALKAQDAAQKEAERERVQRERDLKVSNNSVEQIVEEAKDAATQAAQEQQLSTLRRLQKEKRAVDKQVELTRNAAAAESAQLISSIDELLAEATGAAKESERSKIEGELAASRERVAELEGILKDRSLMGLCQRELSPEDLKEVEELPYNINAFAAAADVNSFDQRKKSALGKVMNRIFETAITTAHPTDQAGVLAAATARREASSTAVGAAVLSAIGRKGTRASSSASGK